MNLAIKLYETIPSEDENVKAGISLKIPAIVIFGEAPDETYQTMTQEQYNEYLQEIQPELDEWQAIQEVQSGLEA